MTEEAPPYPAFPTVRYNPVLDVVEVQVRPSRTVDVVEVRDNVIAFVDQRSGNDVVAVTISEASRTLHALLADGHWLAAMVGDEVATAIASLGADVEAHRAIAGTVDALTLQTPSPVPVDRRLREPDDELSARQRQPTNPLRVRLLDLWECIRALPAQPQAVTRADRSTTTATLDLADARLVEFGLADTYQLRIRNAAGETVSFEIVFGVTKDADPAELQVILTTAGEDHAHSNISRRGRAFFNQIHLAELEGAMLSLGTRQPSVDE